MNILRFILRCVFLPIGLIMLGGTAIIELMADKPDWVYWRRVNSIVFETIWLGRFIKRYDQ